ncbi:MAG: hypothetical protein AAGA90_08920 [Actinomycetota bacterium]
MTTDVFDDLGARLDRLADAHAPDLSGLTPAEEPGPRRRVAVLAVSAAAVAIVVALLRGGPGVQTETPAEDPEPILDDQILSADLPPPTFGVEHLPAVFARPAEVDDTSLSVIEPATMRSVDFVDGTVVIGMSPSGHTLCATMAVALEDYSTASGGIGCLAPAAYISSQVGIAGPLRLQIDGAEVAWFGGLAPIDTRRVLVDGVEAPLVDGLFLQRTGSADALVEFELENGTVHRANSTAVAPADDQLLVPRDSASPAGSRLAVPGQTTTEVTAAGCVRHEHGWDVFAGRDRTWIAVDQTSGLTLVVDGAVATRTTTWTTTPVEHARGYALDIRWVDGDTTGDALVVCGDHDAEIGIFRGGPATDGTAAEVTAHELVLPAWVDLGVVDPDTIDDEVLDGRLPEMLDELFDLATLRRIPSDLEFYVGLDDDHTVVNTALVSGDTLGLSVSSQPIARMVGANLSTWGFTSNGPDSTAWGLVPAGVVTIQPAGGLPFAVTDGAYAVGGVSGAPTFIDAEGTAWDPWDYPVAGTPGATLLVEGTVDGEPLGARVFDRSVCLRADDAVWIWTFAGSPADEFITVQRDGTGVTIESVGDANVRLGQATATEIVESERVAGDLIVTTIEAASDSLDATISVTCPSDAPHLVDLITAVRGGG